MKKPKTADALVGMHLIMDDGEYFRTGTVAAAVGSGGYLIEFDVMKEGCPRPPLEIFTTEELVKVCRGCNDKRVSLFKSRVAMERWLAWMNAPDKSAGEGPKVVHLRKSPTTPGNGGDSPGPGAA
jgi:hypothetical protein